MTRGISSGSTTISVSATSTRAEQSAKPRSKSNYRPEIDGVRALAVIAVIVNHFNPEILPSGFLGVDIFFVISGFVVTASLSKKATNLSWREYLLTFYARRIKRLFPALAICVAITALVGCLFIDQPATSIRTGIAALVGFSNLYLFKQSVDYFGQSAEFNLFTQTWSLGVEEQFYLLFPILLGLCGFSRQQRYRGKQNLCLAVLGLGLLSGIGYGYFVRVNPSAAFFLMPTRFWELGAGCLAFLVVNQVSAHVSSNSVKSAVAFVSTAALIGVLFLSKDLQAFSTLATVLLTCTVILSLESNSTLFKAFSHRGMVQIGRLSYSLYLWHWSVLVISRWTIGVSSRTIPLQVLLIVGLALLSYFLVEKPLRHAQWSSKTLHTIAYGFGGILSSTIFLAGLMAPLNGKLYLGQTFPEAKTTSFTLSKDYKGCQDARSVSTNLVECAYPAAKAVDTQTVYFVGDSHSGALKALASRLVEQGQTARVVMVARKKCFFSTSLVRELETGQSMKNCRTSAQSFFDNVLQTGRAGDVVILTNRYLAYFLTPNYFSDAARVKRGDFSLSIDGARLSQGEALNAYTQELQEVAQALSRRGISLVVQAPLPDWKHLPHECQPEWFRTAIALPKSCKLSAASESARRLPILTAFQQAAATSDNLYVFDPFSVFCHSKNCSPFSDEGVPLFKDDDHLNNYGAEALYPDFAEFLRQHALIAVADLEDEPIR
ncbi:MAG: acyltransferase family protein [Cyanobacteria bacterium P01_D01_bin.56]